MLAYERRPRDVIRRRRRHDRLAGYSRALFALFTLDQTLESFLRGHVAAFEALGGSARTLVYDNLRSAVLDRRGNGHSVSPPPARAGGALSLCAPALYAGPRQ